MGNDTSRCGLRQKKKKISSESAKSVPMDTSMKTSGPPKDYCDTAHSIDNEDTNNSSYSVSKKKRPGQPTPPKFETSVESFKRQSPSRRQQKEKEHDTPMITDCLTNVKERWHINPEEIGHGHYGVVRKCMNRKTGEWFAIKSIRKSKVNRVDVLKRETDILKEVNHPNIIRLIEVHEDKKYLHLITELCTGGELFDRIISKTQSPEGHFSEKDAANLVRCILDAIAYCHDEKQIVHRDLKPENFLYASHDEKSPIKIIDFGLSRWDVDPGSIMKTKVGTPYYVAPEVLRRSYTKSCDIWSIGVITYILLCGYPPFYGDSDTQIFDSVRAGRFDFPSPEWDTISSSAKDFICCLLKKDPNQRLTAKQAMQHKWIVEYASNGSTARPNLMHGKRRSQVFKSYMGMEKLKKTALGYIANELTPAEVGNLGEVFKTIDQDDDGSMTLKDLDNALSSENFSIDLLQKLRNLREDLSLSGEERLDWKDFLAAMMDKSLLMKEDKIKMAFDHFRKSDDNRLDYQELVDVLGGESATRAIIDLDGFDTSEPITYDEFKAMLEGSFSD